MGNQRLHPSGDQVHRQINDSSRRWVNRNVTGEEMIAKNRRWTLRRVDWFALILFCVALSAHRTSAGDEPSDVDKLASKNSPWVIKGNPGKETASKGDHYSVDESTRIQTQVAATIRNSEKLWFDLVMHLDDQRHSGVVGIDAGYPRNWTVGDVCQNILGESLSAPFYRHFPGTKMNYHRFRRPSFAKDKKELSEWCLSRKELKLFELQIEACEWALTELASPDIREWDIKPDQKKEIAEKIRREIERLKESRTAVAIATAYDIR